MKEKKIDAIFHLAAEAGVRRSIKKPLEYVEENISNTIRVFEFAKKIKLIKFIMLHQVRFMVIKEFIQQEK